MIIEHAFEGSDLHKQLIGGQAFMAKYLKSIAERGKPAIIGTMVTLMEPMMGLFAKKERRIEQRSPEPEASDLDLKKEG